MTIISDDNTDLALIWKKKTNVIEKKNWFSFLNKNIVLCINTSEDFCSLY